MAIPNYNPSLLSFLIAATRQAILSALQSSRYVHISTHGLHNVNAAAFQRLFISPDDSPDGRLFALDAFYTAQQARRKKYDKYRDWGAFYMIGQ